MKKTIAILLALALCLSLCACGVDKQYEPLLEALEANNYEGIKSALGALSPDFANEQEELVTYRQYKSLINSLENEDYEAALSEVAAMIPAPPEPVYQAQEITMDNWDTYFELVQNEDWRVNGFGEAEDYRVDYQLKLRDEYLEKVNRLNFNLSVELSFTANYHDATVDLTTREVMIGDIATNISGEDTGEVSRVNDVTYFDETGILSMYNASSYLIQWDNGTQSMYVIEDIPTVTRIQGTIELLAE